MSATRYSTLKNSSSPGRLVASALEIGWLVTALLIPLFVNFWAHRPFELSKVVLLRSSAWFLTGLWLIDWWMGGDDPRSCLRRNPMVIPVILLAIVLLLATVLAVNPLLSLFGTVTRGQGLLTWISYLLLFIVVTTRLYEWEQVRRLLAALVIAAVPMILLSLGQAVGRDPLAMVSDARAPVYATLGRANFVGAYLAMLLPLTLALAIMSAQRRHRGVLILLAVGEVIVIALTRARGAWLAAGTSLVTFGLLLLWPRLDHRGRRSVLVGGMLVCLVGIASGVGMVLRAQGGSLAARRTIWRAVGELISARPLQGYGPDSLTLVFPRVYPPELVYYQGRDLFVDRAHNLLLDWTVTLGLPGMLAFLSVMIRFFVQGLRRFAGAVRLRRRPRLTVQGTVLAACLAAVAGNLVGNLVSFDVTATTMVTWLLLALVTSPAMAQDPESSLSPPIPAQGPDVSWPRWVGAVLLLLVLGIGIAQLNIRPLMASVAHRTAMYRLEIGDQDGAIAAAQRSVRLWPWEPEHHHLLGQMYWHGAEHADDDVPSWARVEASLLAARDLHPEDYAAWVLLGDVYAAIGMQVDPGAFSYAHGAYQQAASLAPHHARLYVAWGQVYLAEGRPDAALTRFRRAVDLDATDGLAFCLIGDVKLAKGRPEAALQAYKKAAHWSPEAALAHLGLARAHLALGQPHAARQALDRAVALDPHHPAVHAVMKEHGGVP